MAVGSLIFGATTITDVYHVTRIQLEQASFKEVTFPNSKGVELMAIGIANANDSILAVEIGASSDYNSFLFNDTELGLLQHLATIESYLSATTTATGVKTLQFYSADVLTPFLIFQISYYHILLGSNFREEEVR